MLAIVDSHARVSRAEVHTDDQWLLSSLSDMWTVINRQPMIQGQASKIDELTRLAPFQE
jgi:hypothetical protein